MGTSEKKQISDGGGLEIEPEALSAVEKQKHVEGKSVGCLAFPALRYGQKPKH